MRPAEEIARMLPIPEDIGGSAFTGKWRSASAHISPERMTPLKEALLFKTNAALYSLVSAAMVWQAERLRAQTDVSPLLDMAEALYAWQQDWHWFGRTPAIADIDTIDEAPRPQGSVLMMLDLIHQDHIYTSGHWPSEPIFSVTADMLVLTRFNLPADAVPAFDAWVEAVIARMDVIAEFPEHGETPELEVGDTPDRRAWAAKVMGRPLPPSVLDLSRDPDPSRWPDEWRDLLARLDWDRNPFLRRPVGTPHPRQDGEVP
ncbi:hypothetical protein SAMN05421763_103147 [[Luteovulum] sphaeroides subsp. megalophilum]|uniref:hypothetical protein n=1 Tax=Cereibacter sphaeroides TaxID=1063 RepID=UPI000B75CAF7|nr:hypothetical protein [Cereibacter sphaeroides]SNS83789.1 hypothetical protein SAMN05421763_103147 [[Luteovulum] sphaeroides subsp. megalophilum]